MEKNLVENKDFVNEEVLLKSARVKILSSILTLNYCAEDIVRLSQAYHILLSTKD